MISRVRNRVAATTTQASARFQQGRKNLVKRLEGLLPSIDADEFLNTHSIEFRSMSQGYQPVGLPAHTTTMLNEWSNIVSEQGLYEAPVACRVLPRLGLIWANGRVVWGSSDARFRERGIRLPSLVLPARRLPEAILLHNHFAGSYFHFHNNFLSKAILADEFELSEKIPFLVPEHIAQTPFFQETWALGFFGNREIVIQRGYEAFRVDRAWLIRAYDCDRDHYDNIANRIAPDRPLDGQERILIQRHQKFGRHFQNQNEMMELLAPLGVRPVVPETMKLTEQADLFARAELIIGAHGAGLTNMMFRRAPASVVEIFSDKFGSPHYWIMANQRGFTHRSVMSTAQPTKHNRADSRVDLDELKGALSSLELRRP